jgi:ABC-type transport system substrate-binding protein
VRDQQTLSLMFESGDIDIADFISGGPAVQLRKKMPDAFMETKNTGVWICDLDVTQPPTDDKNLRLALFSCIDWEKMANTAWEGEQPPALGGGLIPSGYKCYDPNWKPYPMEVAKAKEYLSKSKYAGKVPKIRISTAGSDPNRIRAAQILQEYWRVNLGLEDVEIKNAESEFGDTGKTMINIRVLSAGGALPHQYAVSLTSPTGVHVTRFTKWEAPEIAAQAAAIAALDPSGAEYCAAVQKVMKAISGEAVYLPLGWIKNYIQRQKWVKNFDLNWGRAWVSFMDGYVAKKS